MEYAQNAIAAPRPVPELGRLKMASERVGVARSKIENFVARFLGPVPQPGVSADVGQGAAEGYRNDLESLFIQIECLENIVSALDGIG